ncbi:hypothetical protein CS8_098180 [Cupriavidus sp. 8B]
MHVGERGFRVIVGRLEIRAVHFNVTGIQWVERSIAHGFAVYSKVKNGDLRLEGTHSAFDDAFTYCLLAFSPRGPATGHVIGILIANYNWKASQNRVLINLRGTD